MGGRLETASEKLRESKRGCGNNRNPLIFLARPLGLEWFGTPLLDTHYGPWGKDNVVCSEADWALINAAGRNIPKSGDRIKTGAGVDFSPADFQNSQYFLVTPLW